jgi:hypothetical protein
MNLSYPHREALVVRNHELRVMRRLSGNPDVKVRAGERIAPDQVIARTDPTAAAIKIPIADQLGVGPQDVTKYLMRPIGATFAAGEALARARKGLRNVIVAAPAAGVLLSVDPATGVGSLAPGNGGEVKALVPGDVEFVDGREAVSIRTVGARLLGIVGLGEAASGPVRVIASGPAEEIPVGKIGPELKGAIVAGGSWASAAALKKLVAVGASGLVCGGIVEREIAAAVGYQVEDRFAPWRVAPGERALGENITLGIAVMATEGFGQLPMHPEAFALLKEVEGSNAVVIPTTRITGALLRPEFVVPDTAALDKDGQSSHAAFVEGAQVRLTDQAGLGGAGVVVRGPRRARLGDGLMVDVVDVELTGGSSRTAPIANVEIVA